MCGGCPDVMGIACAGNELNGMDRGKCCPKKQAASGSNKHKSRDTFYIYTMPQSISLCCLSTFRKGNPFES